MADTFAHSTERIESLPSKIGTKISLELVSDMDALLLKTNKSASTPSAKKVN